MAFCTITIQKLRLVRREGSNYNFALSCVGNDAQGCPVERIEGSLTGVQDDDSDEGGFTGMRFGLERLTWAVGLSGEELFDPWIVRVDEATGVAVVDDGAFIQEQKACAVVNFPLREGFHLARLLVVAVGGQGEGIL